MNSKIGLFGGSFDPVHRAHFALAVQALQQAQLDRVIWLPTAISPFKKSSEMLASPAHRLAMVKLVCAAEPRFETSAYEIEKGGISYSIETLRHFQQVIQNAQFFWILGTDTLTEISKWKESEALVRDLTFLAAGRGEDKTEFSAALKVQRLDLDWDPVSSTQIKTGLAQGKFWDQLHPEVTAYIRQHRLYGVGK